MSTPNDRPRLLLVGGGGGFVGRAVLSEFEPHFAIRSVHRYPARNEGPDVEWVPADVRSVKTWAPLLEQVQVVVNLAWYRWETASAFRDLHDGLRRLIDAAGRAGIHRFLQVSVPPAPSDLETQLPYLVYKRRVDSALVTSGVSYRIVRPTMLFGRGDVLLSVMMRIMRRYSTFPMFGSGMYHVSPVDVLDLARILRQEAEGDQRGTLDIGGPERLTYQELTDRMFAALGKPPRYWRLSETGARRLTRLMVAFGSKVLYPYEVEWLMSDMLGLPAYKDLDPPLHRVDDYLGALAAGARSPPD
jgi:uncharacterized protein YbjT (DUF2867 family)